MSAGAGRARVLLACCAVSIVAYAVASPAPAVQALALLLGGVGLVVGSPLVGVSLPRWLVGLATLGVLLYTLNRTMAEGLGVGQFAEFVTWMIVVKLFDRRRAGDDAQLLAYSVFLALAAVIVSNGLLVGVLTIGYLPLLAFAAMQLQLRLALQKAERLAAVGVVGRQASPRVRAVAGVGAVRALRRTSFSAIVLGLGLAALVFVVVPRGAGLQQIGRLGNPAAGRVVAFSDRVRVGSGGAISVSRRPVLLMALRDWNGQLMGGQGAVKYLRGSALDQYEEGTWYASGAPDVAGERHSLVPEQGLSLGATGGSKGQYQEITLLATPSDYSYLFTMWRPTKITPLDPASIAYSARTGMLMVDAGGGKFRYKVRSEVESLSYRRRSQRGPASWDSPVVAGVAERILREAGIEPDPARRAISSEDEPDDRDAILAFRRYFWDNYTYSLGEPPPPPGREPIEWFLTETDRGHCEHYAAALAALCRSVGISARVVTGYLAVEYVESSESYIVRESNAHAWVEAQAEPGLWETFDATPPSDLVNLHGPRPGFLGRAGRLLDRLNYAWVNSIVSFDSGSRAELLSLDSPQMKNLTEKADEVMGALRKATVGEVAVLAVKIFGVTVLVMGLSWVGVQVILRVRGVLARRPAGIPRRIADSGARARVAETPIYQEMLTVLARAGYRKPGWQPPRAWGGSLSTSLAAGPLVAELSELYYCMRFGGRELDAAELARAREVLDGIRDSVGR